MIVEKPERLTGYARASLKTGLIGSRSVSLVFTERRIIVATITKELEKEETKRAMEDARAVGKGVFGQMAASTLLLGQSFERRYSAMVPSEILTGSLDNFDIPFTALTGPFSRSTPSKIIRDWIRERIIVWSFALP